MLQQLNEISAPSVLALFDTTKQQRQSFAAQVLEQLKDGQTEPLNVHLQIKCMEEIIKTVKDDPEYKTLVLEAAQKNGKSFEYHSAKVEVKETGTKYNYNNCNDPEHALLSQQLEALEVKIKAREKFLQNVPEGGHEMLLEGGELVTVYRPVKTSTTAVAVTLK